MLLAVVVCRYQSRQTCWSFCSYSPYSYCLIFLVYSFSYSEKCIKVLHWKGFPCGSAGKISACNAGGLGSIPGLGRSPGEGKGYPLQYSGLENPMDYIESDKTERLFTFTVWKSSLIVDLYILTFYVCQFLLYVFENKLPCIYKIKFLWHF